MLVITHHIQVSRHYQSTGILFLYLDFLSKKSSLQKKDSMRRIHPVTRLGFLIFFLIGLFQLITRGKWDLVIIIPIVYIVTIIFVKGSK